MRALTGVVADAAGTIDLSNRTDVRARITQNATTPNPGYDIVDTPMIRLDLATHQWAYSAGYSAMVSAIDIETPTPPLVVQSADVGATWHNRLARLSLAEYGSYGQTNFTTTGPLPATTGGVMPPSQPTVGLLPQSLTINYGLSRTSLTASDRLSRLNTFNLALDYTVQGGLDATSQTVLPLVRGPLGQAWLLSTLSRVDALESRVSAQLSNSSLGPCAPFIPTSDLTSPNLPIAQQLCDPTGQIEQFSETWQRRISRTTELSLGAGAAFVQVRFQDTQAGFQTAEFPVAIAGLQYKATINEAKTTLRLDLALAPFVDLRSGVVDERAQITGSFRRPVHRWVYIGSIGGVRSVDSPFILPATTLQLSFEADYTVSPLVAVGGGARYFWQDQEGFGELSFGVLFAQVTVHAPVTTF